MLLDLNGIPGYQSNSEDILFSLDLVEGHNAIPWNGLNGLGNIVPSGTNIPITINYINVVTHLPMYDVEGNPRGFKTEIVRPYTTEKTLPMFWDDSNISGGTVELNGCINPSGCHKWGMGSCGSSPPPSYCSLGDMRTINTWWYAPKLLDDI